MNRLLLYLSFFLLTAAALTSCDEVTEEDAYANWSERNIAFADSIKALAGNNLFNLNAEGDLIDRFEVGEIFGLQTTASTNMGAQYVYCKKVVKNLDGARPFYTSSVSAYYYGTLINGDMFDGNFEGYGALDRGVLDPVTKAPTDFDSPATFSVSGVIAGWTWALQYMHEGERWMLYVPYQSAYGTSDYSSIPGYSTLTFDLVLDEVL
ncbi:FKBP-type peptidyl-prolyl cis-trans isomerase [uncultured Bacteroides sp.]|uniref:FKBP-type peptidyl-prolyl cis-trans isomerase n=1 Tax=uncultured Bacteroides sp. TaxID=162156 RepID=UPI002637CE96|nr:FKBP-type peptidyl-prolyl cis-trans isomerase [uncultured Bacteroides sp.]